MSLAYEFLSHFGFLLSIFASHKHFLHPGELLRLRREVILFQSVFFLSVIHNK